jgi:hypothetical protein
MLHDIILNHTRQFMSHLQHGFLPGRSVDTNLCCFVQYVFRYERSSRYDICIQTCEKPSTLLTTIQGDEKKVPVLTCTLYSYLYSKAAKSYFDEPREKLSSRPLCGRDKTISRSSKDFVAEVYTTFCVQPENLL